MKRFLLDVNVVLDVLLDRRPHAAAASALWAAGERGECDLVLPAHALTTIFYLAARQRDLRFARGTVADLLATFGVAPIDARVLQRALTLEMADFEDGVAAAAAEASGCEAVITRDLGDFDSSPVPAIDPATALALLAET